MSTSTKTEIRAKKITADDICQCRRCDRCVSYPVVAVLVTEREWIDEDRGYEQVYKTHYALDGYDQVGHICPVAGLELPCEWDRLDNESDDDLMDRLTRAGYVVADLNESFSDESSYIILERKLNG